MGRVLFVLSIPPPSNRLSWEVVLGNSTPSLNFTSIYVPLGVFFSCFGIGPPLRSTFSLPPFSLLEIRMAFPDDLIPLGGFFQERGAGGFFLRSHHRAINPAPPPLQLFLFLPRRDFRSTGSFRSPPPHALVVSFSPSLRQFNFSRRRPVPFFSMTRNKLLIPIVGPWRLFAHFPIF